MADTQQTAPPPAKRRRPPRASAEELLEDREETKKLFGEMMAETAERTDRVLAAQTAQTDALRNLAETLTPVAAALVATHGGRTPGEAGAQTGGSAEEVTPTAGTVECAADDVEDEPDETAEKEPEAADADETTADAQENDDDPEAGQGRAEDDAATTAEQDDAASHQADGKEAQSQGATEETPAQKTEPAGTAAPKAAARGDAGGKAQDTSDRPAGEGEADETESEERGATPGEAEILAVLSSMREDMGNQGKLIQHIHRTPLPRPAAAGETGTGTAEHAERRYHDLTGYLDKFVVALIEHVGGAEQSTAGNLPDRPPPTDVDKAAAAVSDLAKQLRAERRRPGPLAWIAAVAATIALLAMLTAGIFLQKEFDVMPSADLSLGWKDRVWEEKGPEIAACLNLEDAGAGDCVVTVTPPGQ